MIYKLFLFSLFYGCYIPAFHEYSNSWKIIGDLPNYCLIESIIDRNGSLINLYILNHKETEYIYKYYSIDIKNQSMNKKSLVIEIYSKPKFKPEFSKTFINYLTPYDKLIKEKYFFYSSYGNWIKVNEVPLRVKEGKYHIDKIYKEEPIKLINNYLVTEVNLEFYLGINFDKFFKNKENVFYELFNKKNLSFSSCLIE